MKIGGYQILDLYNYTFTVGTGVKVDGSYKLIKAMRGKPINTSRIRIDAVTYDAAYLAFIPDGTSFKATFGDKTITIAADDTITFTNGIIGGGGGGGTQVQADWDEDDPNEPSYIQNKPTLAAVATSGDYDDLNNKPSIPAPQVQADWDEDDPNEPSYIQNKPTLAAVATSGDYDDLNNKPSIPAPQVQADWSESDTTEPSYIQNKPTIPTGIPAGGTAGQVLTKDSSTDYDAVWATPSGGDINVGSGIAITLIGDTLPTSGVTKALNSTTGNFASSSQANACRALTQGEKLLIPNLTISIDGAIFVAGTAIIQCTANLTYSLALSAIGVVYASSAAYALRLMLTSFTLSASENTFTINSSVSYISNLS